MATKKPHGTIAAARHHERRGEDLCERCVTARREHNAAQYRRRRALADERPAAAAKLPAGLTELPAPWVLWESTLTRPAEEDPDGVLVRRTWTTTWAPDFGDRYQTVDRVVNAWLSDEPGAADMLTAMPRKWQAQALDMLGYSTISHREMVRPADASPLQWSVSVDLPSETDECPAEPPETPDHPWPLHRHDWVTDVRVEPGAVEVDGEWVISRSEGLIARAPAGTPIPEGWTDASAEATSAPWRIKTLSDAITATMTLRRSDLSTVVLVERDGRTHVYRGIGGTARDLGPWDDVSAGIAAAVEDIEEEVEGLRWGAAEHHVSIFRSSGVSWDAMSSAQPIETRSI